MRVEQFGSPDSSSPRQLVGGNASRIGRLERLPKWLNLFPIVTQWAWLSLKYRSITLPSCCNPAITTGGMVGEGKVEYLDIMGVGWTKPARPASFTCEDPVTEKDKSSACSYGISRASPATARARWRN